MRVRQAAHVGSHQKLFFVYDTPYLFAIVARVNAIFHQKLERLEEEVSYLESNRDRLLPILPSDREARRLVERSVYLCAEMVLDLADLIIIARGLTKPATYREAIRKLGEIGVLPGEFAYHFSYIAGLRNFLAHDYLKDTSPALQDFLLQKLADVRLYLRHLKNTGEASS